MTTKQFTHYVITAPDGRQYVGVTMRSIEIRFREHKKRAESGDEATLYAVMRELGIDRFSIDEIHEGTMTADEANALEKEFISTIRPVLNGSAGGDHPGELSEETRQRMSRARMGHVVSEETRLRMKQAQSNRSESTRKKLSQSKLKENLSEETLQKRSESLKAAWARRREEGRTKKGPTSDETKQKIREKLKAAWSRKKIVTDPS